MNIQELVNRRIDLALQSEIPDMEKYAEQWNRLAADFRAMGAMSNAALCESNYNRYRTAAGQHIRLTYDNYAELISTEAQP